MKIVAICANGIIGQAVTRLLAEKHEVIAVGHSRGDITVDLEDSGSIRALFEHVGPVDAIISTAGNGEMGTIAEMPNEGYATVLRNKLMGQVNLARIGLEYLNDNGSITLTSGQAASQPMPGTAAIAIGVAGINAFVGVAALELDKGKPINAVSPAIVKETLEQWGADSSHGIPARQVATFYQTSIESQANGQVFDAIKDH